MPRKGSFFRCVLLVLLLASFVSCASYRGRPVRSYRGDGNCTTVIANESLFGFLITRGYHIDFGQIDLGKASEVQYSIQHLPSTNGNDLRFYVDVSGNDLFSEKDLKNKLHGRLTMRLTSDKGKQIFDCSAPIQQWRVTGSLGSPNKLRLYWRNANDDVSDLRGGSASAYSGFTIFVKYEPAPQDVQLEGTVQAEVGGFF